MEYVLLYVILNDNVSCMTNALKLRYHYKYYIDMSLSTIDKLGKTSRPAKNYNIRKDFIVELF